MPQEIKPVETIPDFVEQCWKVTIAGGALGGGMSSYTAWMLDGFASIKIAFFSSVGGAFLHGHSCYEYNQQTISYTEQGYLEKYLPYIVDIGVGMHVLKQPATSSIQSVAIIQKAVLLLNSIVVSDVVTKTTISFIPDTVKIYANAALDITADKVQNSMSNIGKLLGVINYDDL